jgi:hypothetical protein
MGVKRSLEAVALGLVRYEMQRQSGIGHLRDFFRTGVTMFRRVDELG